MLKRMLIANRGEIAIRIAKAADALGILYRRHEADLVGAVVQAEIDTVDAQDLRQETVAPRQRQVARGDGPAQRAVLGALPVPLEALVGRTARRAVEEGDFFYPGDLTDAVSQGRHYSFRRPWGLPVRYHDYAKLMEGTNPDFLEFHFSYKDLEIEPASVFDGLVERFAEHAPGGVPLVRDGRLAMSYTCHSPDLFTGDFLLNLASTDDAHWERSIAELQRVVDTTTALRQWFSCDEDPVVIASLGGFTTDRHVPVAELPAMYARVAAGLDRVDFTGVRLGAQTLPPYPWYMGGQLYCNLFVRAEDTAGFARDYGRSLTLDVSHSKLSANWEGRPFSEYVELLAPHAVHLHLSLIHISEPTRPY